MLYMTVLARCTWVNCLGERHGCAGLHMGEILTLGIHGFLRRRIASPFLKTWSKERSVSVS